MNQEAKTEASVEVTPQELRLRPGTELTIRDSTYAALSHKAQFIATFPGKSILISLLVNNTLKIALHEGEEYVFKGFTGKYDFSFKASVLQIDKAQFNARISYPERITVKLVRKHIRVELTLATKALVKDVSTPVVMSDLSTEGACVNSKISLGAIGERFQLTLPVEFDKKKINLDLASEIRHVTETDQGLKTGVAFMDISQQDKLFLHYFVGTLHDAEVTF